MNASKCIFLGGRTVKCSEHSVVVICCTLGGETASLLGLCKWGFPGVVQTDHHGKPSPRGTVAAGSSMQLSKDQAHTLIYNDHVSCD